MKSKLILILVTLYFFTGVPNVKSQDLRNFPFDPFVILKSWTYDSLVKSMGNGEEVIRTMRNQSYLAGLRYPSDLLGMQGKLEFTFSKDSISLFQFRKEHAVRIIDEGLSDRLARDTAAAREYNRGLQKLDSLRRDSVVNAISEILGPPLINGPTTVAEKNARHSAVWINRGYSCGYKDYINYSEIVFVLTQAPEWAVREFELPPGLQLLLKTMNKTRKMNWSASLLGLPSTSARLTFSDIFLLLEFSTELRFLVSVPKNPVSFLPTLSSEDCDGDAVPEAWIKIPADVNGSQSRNYIYSLQFKEPNLIFNSDELCPSTISLGSNSKVAVTFPDMTVRNLEYPGTIPPSNQNTVIKPNGFISLNTTRLNTDGTTNFIGSIDLRISSQTPDAGMLEITYQHTPNGWEAGQMRILPAKK